MADVFEQFDGPKLVKGGVDATDAGDRAYVAYHAVDKHQQRLKVLPVEGVSDRLPYRMLLRIMEQGRAGTSITLVYSFMAVLVEGRNLGAVADAIQREHCEFVEQFDPARHDLPADPRVPFISNITLYAAAGMETMGQGAGRSGAGKKAQEEEPV